MAALVFFAALSLNLLVNFALGIKELVRRERSPVVQIYYPWIILFVSTLLLWVLFARVLFFLDLDFLLVFPFSILGSQELEKIFFSVFKKVKGSINLNGPDNNPEIFSIGSSYNGLAAAALFLTLRFALSFIDAALLSFAFSAGGLLAFLVIKEIQKRSFLETIPRSLQGTPILLISMGLLSLVFSAASVLLLKIFL
ncbi:MAG: hypothetical protein FWG27_03065 [Treponema sp.]|jgi:electron transport complex protein RnfA|nr:hypothetical protein [Treponema sp.]